jgi:hypothetical protein
MKDDDPYDSPSKPLSKREQEKKRKIDESVRQLNFFRDNGK